MLLLYVSHLSPRFRYISRLIFGELLGLQIRYTEDKEEYLHSTLAKINYSREALQSGIFLQASSLYQTLPIQKLSLVLDLIRMPNGMRGTGVNPLSWELSSL